MDRLHLFHIHVGHDGAWLHMRREGQRVPIANRSSDIGWFFALRDYRGEFTLVRATTAPSWW